MTPSRRTEEEERGCPRSPRRRPGDRKRPGGHPGGDDRAGHRGDEPQRTQNRGRHQRCLHRDARSDGGVPGAGGAQARFPGSATPVRDRDRRAGRDAARRSPDDAHRDDEAALRPPARLPARCRGVATGHRAVTERGSASSRATPDADDLAAAGPGLVPGSVVVIGTGLIGTSISLALREREVSVWLADADAEAVLLAVKLGAGQPLPAGGVPGGPADVAVLAVPPALVAAELRSAQTRGIARAYTDVASVKELPLAGARELGCDLASYLPGHPLSGRERSGPAAARADLFVGRPWVLCPQPANDTTTIRLGTGLAEACGALPVAVPSADHDQWVALVSHAPHVVAAAMAARLEGAPEDALALAGQGLRDV